ncbi:MAG: VOC family protein [Saprospiraceae bacterium]
MKYVHTNIITDDWKRLSQFYINVFQCAVMPPPRDQKGEWLETCTGVKNAHLVGVHLRLPGYDADGPTLEIYQYAKNERGPEPIANRKGFGHIAFEMNNVQNVLEQVLINGGSKLGEIVTKVVTGLGTITLIYVKDPDGNIIELQKWDC